MVRIKWDNKNIGSSPPVRRSPPVKSQTVKFHEVVILVRKLSAISDDGCDSPIGGSLPPDDADNVLHIGGIFPIAGEGGWQGGQACMPAVNLALDDVNHEKNLLPGFILKLHSNDSECEPGLGASVMYNLLYYKPHKLMLLAGCSTVCTTVAEAAKMWNLVVTVEDLEARCKEAGIEIVTRQSFLSDPSDAVRNLRRQDARIIVGLFYVVAARRVLCELYQQKLYGKSYVWFFIGWYEDNWFEVNLDKEAIACTKDQMRLAAEGHLTTEALMWNQNNDTTISGMTSEDFRQRLNKMLKEDGYDIDNNRYPEGYQEAPLAYDAVWSVALAFNKTMEKLSKQGKSLKNFTYTDKEIADEIYSAINSTQFLGVSLFMAKQKVSSIQKKVQPWKLYTMVSGLLVMDIVLLVSWQVLDPLQRKIETFPLELSPFGDDDARIRPELEHCESIHNNIWLGLIYSYKGLILVFGLFLAYETRSIKVKQINDSRYVGMSIYNVVVLCLITAPVTMVIASQQDASFAFVALAIIFCCFLSMALIFVPKVIEVIRHPKDKAESKYNPDVGMSKEDEEKYQKLLSENDELQKLIAAVRKHFSVEDKIKLKIISYHEKTSFQKEEKIKLLKQTLAERDALKGGSGNVPKDSLIVADFVTGEGTSDSAIGGGISVYTQSSRASASDFEFSGSYL
ncbi:hypothetical protein E2986_12436 [Frieseomelitta varia]|uniref:G-protein coupled receptors family 3 profile domain-containing protein n=1 Tax=Frieseomelitta varia TaxID=561572 RepID=A0A833VP62_9HYME|nr:hypothetical protein E2986_12436 [Frieseomelitta varia]